MKKSLLLIPLLLASTTLLGAAAKVKWSSAQLSSTQKVCASAALKSNPKANSKQANSYCKCALDKAATKWEYADFVKNEEKYTKQLGNEGVINKCAKEALQIKS